MGNILSLCIRERENEQKDEYTIELKKTIIIYLLYLRKIWFSFQSLVFKDQANIE